MLTKLYLLACHQIDLAYYHLTEIYFPPGHVRKDLRCYRYTIGQLNPITNWTAPNDIHKDTVEATTVSYRVNAQLEGRPP